LGGIKEDWESGDPSGVKGRSPGRESGGRSPPVGSRGRAMVWGLGDEVPQKLKLFVKLRIIFALKYNKQQLLSLE